MLGNLRISSKLLVMVGLSVLGILVVAGVGLSALKDNLLEDRKTKLKDLVLMARQAVELDYQSAKKAGLSDADAMEQSKRVIRTLRFGNDDYFYALGEKGVIHAHPNPKMENVVLYDKPDAD